MTETGKALQRVLNGYKVSAAAAALAIGVPDNRLSQIIAGKRKITIDTALRLGRYTPYPTEWWLNLQQTQDIQEHMESIRAELAGIIPIYRTGQTENRS